MGRGKGYYDRLLTAQNIYKVGVAFSFQMVDVVPTDDFDIPMDRVIYPK
jgi:5-formyltetrahydrofolate cyclo-ligase